MCGVTVTGDTGGDTLVVRQGGNKEGASDGAAVIGPAGSVFAVVEVVVVAAHDFSAIKGIGRRLFRDFFRCGGTIVEPAGLTFGVMKLVD